MRRDSKKKVPVSGPQTPLGDLGAALEKIKLPDSPEGKQQSAQPERLTTWKMGRVVLRRETARRGGKTVIVIYDFATHLPVSVIEAVAKKVRAACGCGGTVKGRNVEIQGDQVAKIRAVLEAEGFQVAGEK